MDATVKRKLMKARTALVLEHPFFGNLCLRMDPVEDHSCRSAWTDGETFAYNPRYVRHLTDESLKGLLAHTVMHPACQHHKRRNGRDPSLWNSACDYAINWILLDCGLTLPPGYFDDPKYRGRTADEIYTSIAGNHGGETKPAKGENGDGPDLGEAEVDNDGGLAGDDDEGTEETLGQGGDDGDSADGQGDDEGESVEDTASEQSGDPGGSGEVRDADDDSGSGSPEGGDEADESWKIAMAQAANQARDCGDLPGGLARLIEETLYPKLGWRELLDRFIQARARNDYCWTPPSRRHLHMGLYLPSLSQEALPEVVIAVDTSGSIAAQELDQFAAEISSILDQFDTTVRVVYCDREVLGEEIFRREDLPLSFNPSGGGGTDFRPVFELLDRQGMPPACLVYLSDLECPHFPEVEPEYPVLWVRTGEQGHYPPFGEVVDLC